MGIERLKQASRAAGFVFVPEDSDDNSRFKPTQDTHAANRKDRDVPSKKPASWSASLGLPVNGLFATRTSA